MRVRDESVSAALLCVQPVARMDRLAAPVAAPVHLAKATITQMRLEQAFELLFFFWLASVLQALGCSRAERFLNAVSCSAKGRKAPWNCAFNPNTNKK